MINRITIPDSSAFSNAYDGVKPYYSKWSVPKFLVRYADSVLTVNNDGITSYWHLSTTAAIAGTGGQATATFPICKFYYANGTPPFIYKNNANSSWAVKFKANFFALHTAKYTFYFAGSGLIHKDSIKFGGVASSFSSDLYMKTTDTYYQSAHPAQWLSSSWHSIEFIYSSGKNMRPPIQEYGLICMWKTDSASFTPEPIPLSAGVCCGANVVTTGNKTGETIPWHTVNSITGVSYSIEKDGFASLNISVPLVATPYKVDGYIRDPLNSDSLVYYDNSIKIEKYHAIEYYEGYATPTGTQYVKKFTGQVKDFSLGYDASGGDTVSVKCSDFASFMKESFNLFSPTPIDYLQVGYTRFKNNPQIGNSTNFFVDGIVKPVAFDGWDVNKIAQILMTESYIDPYLFYKRKIFTGYNGSKKFGNFKMVYAGATSNSLRLPTSRRYGANTVVDEASQDDKYSYSLNTGDFFYDGLVNILQPYYLSFNFDADGHPCMSSFNAPLTYIDNKQFTKSGNWTEKTDLTCIQGTYLTTANGASYLSTTFSGVAVDLIFKVGPRFSAAGLSAAVTLSIGSDSWVSYPNLYSSTTMGYFDGLDPNTGSNQCVFRVTAPTFKYDTYGIKIQPIAAVPVNFDGMFVYDREVTQPVFTCETDDANLRGNITDLNVETKGSDLRNDVYVYGSLIGDVRAYGPTGDLVTINPNNPVYRYNYAIARDIKSIYSTSASNYVGRPIRMLIQDPKIVNTTQAETISENVLTQYRLPNKSIELTILGNPLLEVNDCIFVWDKFKHYTTCKAWVDSIKTDLSIGDSGIKYLTNIKTVPVQPPNGIWNIPDPVAPASGPIQNIQLRNNGCLVKLVSTAAFHQTTIDVQPAYSSQRGGCINIPERGYMWMYGANPNSGGKKYVPEILYYERQNPSTSTSSCRLICQRGVQGTSSANSLPSSELFYMSFDPYLTETMNMAPNISFDCYANGRVKVQVFGIGETEDYLVDTLTGISDKDWPYDGYDDVSYGSYTYHWGCIDSVGVYNELQTNGEVNAGGYYVSEKEKAIIEDHGYMNKKTFGPSTYTSQYKDAKLYMTISFINNFGVSTTISTKAGGYSVPATAPLERDSIYLDTSGGTIYIRRGAPGVLKLVTSTAGLYYSFDGTDNSCVRLGSSLYYDLGNSYFRWFNAIPYVKNGSNNNKGIMYTLYDSSYGLAVGNNSQPKEPYNVSREYKMDIQWNVYRWVYIDAVNSDNKPIGKWGLYKTSGNLYQDNAYINIWNNGNGVQLPAFNPKKNTQVQFFPKELVADISSLVSQNGFGKLNWVLMAPVVFLSGKIIDKSGRRVFMLRDKFKTSSYLSNLFDSPIDWLPPNENHPDEHYYNFCFIDYKKYQIYYSGLLYNRGDDVVSEYLNRWPFGNYYSVEQGRVQYYVPTYLTFGRELAECGGVEWLDSDYITSNTQKIFMHSLSKSNPAAALSIMSGAENSFGCNKSPIDSQFFKKNPSDSVNHIPFYGVNQWFSIPGDVVWRLCNL